MHKKYLVFLLIYDRPDKKLYKKIRLSSAKRRHGMRGADGAILAPIPDFGIKDCSCNLLARTFIHIINR